MDNFRMCMTVLRDGDWPEEELPPSCIPPSSHDIGMWMCASQQRGNQFNIFPFSIFSPPLWRKWKPPRAPGCEMPSVCLPVKTIGQGRRRRRGDWRKELERFSFYHPSVEGASSFIRTSAISPHTHVRGVHPHTDMKIRKEQRKV